MSRGKQSWKAKRGRREIAMANTNAKRFYMEQEPVPTEESKCQWFYDKPYYFRRKERLAKKVGDENKRRL